jgi:raffinose/stachyose/melibiose transport system substrate-binding protein
MVKKLAKMLCLLLVLALTLSLGACTKKDDTGATTGKDVAETSKEETKAAVTEQKEEPKKEVTIRVYTYYADSNKIINDKAIEYLKEKMPHIKIELEQRIDADETRLKTFAAVGNMPDIFDSWSSVIRTFQKSGDILILDEALEKYKFLDKVIESVKPTLYDVDGHCYAVNTTPPQNALIYYNSKVFEEHGVKVPANYDEFLAAVKAFSQKGVIPLALFAQEKWPGVQFYESLITRYEPKGYQGLEKKTTDISNPAYKKAADKLVELVKAGLISKSAFSTNASQAFELFKIGKAAMILNGTWYLADCAQYGDHIDYLDNPLAEPGQEEATRWNRCGGNSIGELSVAAKSKNVDVAAEVCLQFIIERRRAAVVELGEPNTLTEDVKPAKPRAAIQEKYNNELMNIKTTTCFPWMLENNEFKTALEENVEKMFTGSYSADDFINDMTAAVKEYIK